MMHTIITTFFCLILFFAPMRGECQTEEGSDPKTDLVKAIIRDYGKLIERESAKHGVDPGQVIGMIARESANHKHAVSHKGARGLMQTKSVADRATKIRCNSFNPSCSIRKGIAYSQYLGKKFGLERSILAYLKGPSGVKKYSDHAVRRHPYVRETLAYMEISRLVLAQR